MKGFGLRHRPHFNSNSHFNSHILCVREQGLELSNIYLILLEIHKDFMIRNKKMAGISIGKNRLVVAVATRFMGLGWCFFLLACQNGPKIYADSELFIPGDFEAMVVVDSLKGKAREIRGERQWRCLCQAAVFF